uniref:Copia protein n=1 Tax=Cajanus cajan TaxID=3821 RepID=A0A151QY63_CAJCA|nr:Copia protein [Cajanus cajan]
MKSCGEELEECAVVEKVLRTLDTRFDMISIAIEESKNLDLLKLEELQGSLEAHEQRLRERDGDKSNLEQALLAKQCKKNDGDRGKFNKRGRGRGIRGGNNRGHGSENSGRGGQHENTSQWKGGRGSNSQWRGGRRGNNSQWRGGRRGNNSQWRGGRSSSSSVSDKSYMQCYNCNKYGHYKSWFIELNEKIKTKMKFADNSIVKSEGKGKILIRRRDEKATIISYVLYVPSMKHNLLSIVQLLQKGYLLDWKWKEQMFRILDNKGTPILRAPLSNNKTFRVDISMSKHMCFAVTVFDVNWLWHLRFGHLNFGSLSQLAEKEMVIGLPHIEKSDVTCEEVVSKPMHLFLPSTASISPNIASSCDDPSSLCDSCSVYTHFFPYSSSQSQDDLSCYNSITMIEKFKIMMKDQFEMTDLGKLSYFLGMEFTESKKGILVHQSNYAKEVLKKFRISECNATTTLVEANCSRPDIYFGVGLLSRFMEKPKASHFAVARRIMRYIRGTIDYGILLPNAKHQNGGELVGYSDSDWAGDKDGCRSTSGYVFLMGKSPISWSSKLQHVVALSSCEAEYIYATYKACQALWLESLVKQILARPEKAMTLKIDNKSAINLAKNPIHHGRSKHVEIRFHFIREKVRKNKLKLEHCGTKEQLEDIMTKPLNTRRFVELRKDLNVKAIAELGGCVG